MVQGIVRQYGIVYVVEIWLRGM